MAKGILSFTLLLVVTGGGLWTAWQAYFPPDRAGIQKVTSAANTVIRTDAKGVKKVLADNEHIYDENGMVKIGEWGAHSRPVAKHVDCARRERAIQIALAEGTIPLIGGISMPLTRIATDIHMLDQTVTLKLGYHYMEPDGGHVRDRNWKGTYLNGKPAGYDTYRTVMEVQNGKDSPWVPLIAGLYALCPNGKCGQWRYFDSDSRVIIPEGMPFMIGLNQWVIQSGQENVPTNAYTGKIDEFVIWWEDGVPLGCGAPE